MRKIPFRHASGYEIRMTIRQFAKISRLTLGDFFPRKKQRNYLRSSHIAVHSLLGKIPEVNRFRRFLHGVKTRRIQQIKHEISSFLAFILTRVYKYDKKL